MANNISVVINTLNEESNIADCIHSVQNLADEIVVCDMYSDDRTVKLAQKLGARVVYHERTGFVEPARRFAISQANCEWVLVLDADERMTPNLAAKLKQIAVEDVKDVVVFWSLYLYFGGWVRYGGFYSCSWPRFFRKKVYLETYFQGEEQIHQNFGALRHYPNKIELPAECHVLHLAYPTVEKYVCKTLGRYARIEGEQYYQASRKFSFLRLVGEPVKAFLRSFLLKQGFRDGLRGFILAALYAGYRFTTWANVWLLEELERQKPTEDSAQSK